MGFLAFDNQDTGATVSAVRIRPQKPRLPKIEGRNGVKEFDAHTCQACLFRGGVGTSQHRLVAASAGGNVPSLKTAPALREQHRKRQKPSIAAGLFVFWLPDLDSNQGPAD